VSARRMRRAGWAADGRLARELCALGLTLGLALACGCAAQGPDRFERANRAIFGFNEGLDIYVLEPAAKGWNFAVPDLVQTGIDNFFVNLGMPVVMMNDLLQGKPDPAVYDYCRLFMNTTVGLAGLIDVATAIGIPQNDEDFGLTLGHWGVPSGAYIVLPFFGPSTPRAAFGMAVDAAAGWSYTHFLPAYASASLRAVNLVNVRARFQEDIAEGREAALDFYVFTRDAYLQNRKYKLEGRERGDRPGGAESEDDLYYFEDDLGEDDEDLETE